VEPARERRRPEGSAAARPAGLPRAGARLTEAEARARLGAARVGHLATVGADGRPRVVPLCFALDGERIWSAVDEKPKRTRRLQRLADVEATGRAAVLVDSYDEDWTRLWWVRAEGRAWIAEPAEERARALERLASKYEQYRAEPPQGAVLAVELERLTWWTAAEQQPVDEPSRSSHPSGKDT
jgi:PPOX class probable F420-dependent enzyme